VRKLVYAKPADRAIEAATQSVRDACASWLHVRVIR